MARRSGAPRDARTDVCADEFLATSRRGARRATRTRIVALSGALVVTVVLAGIAIVQRNEARHQTRVAQGRVLVASSVAALPTDPELSLWFAIRAEDTSPSVQADKLLRQSFLELCIRAAYRFPERLAIRGSGCSR